MSDSFPVLTLLILVPIVGAAIVACMPKDNEGLLKLVGVTSAGVALALSIALVFDYQADGGGFQFLSEHVWIRDFGISWKLGVDGISLFLIALTGVLFPLAIVGPSVHRDVKGYVAWMLVLEAGCMGVFLSLDLFLFFLFWELVLVPMYFLIGGWGYDRRIYATIKFFLYTMVGSALMLVGILAVVFLHRRATGELTFDVVTLAEEQSLASSTARWLFLAFAASFAIKVPIFPVHTWLPDAHTEAPDGWFGDPGRRHAEARHLRVPALRALHVPAGVRGPGAGVPDPRHHRHHLRRGGGHHADAT